MSATEGGRVKLDSPIGVAVAATLLVAATCAALLLAPPPGAALGTRSNTADGPVAGFVAGEAGRDGAGGRGATGAVVTTRFDTIPGFRPDLFGLPDDATAGFVAVPGGPFTMGSHPGIDPLAFDLEMWGNGRAQGEPDVPTFLIGRYEITRAQYRAFIAASGHPVVDPSAIRGGPALPVTHVAWTDAIAYTRWLDSALRASPATPDSVRALLEAGWRIDLPSEAQWEKAARGTDGRIYPWGNEFDPAYANVGSRGVVSVGDRECALCIHGLSDMAGNVWEWTRSPYQPYPFTDTDDAETVRADALWVMRGGSFGENEQHARAANRGGADPGARRPFIGFRVVLTR